MEAELIEINLQLIQKMQSYQEMMRINGFKENELTRFCKIQILSLIEQEERLKKLEKTTA